MSASTFHAFSRLKADCNPLVPILLLATNLLISTDCRASITPPAEAPKRDLAEIRRTDSRQMRTLLAARLIIDSVDPVSVHAWLTAEEYEWVSQRGWQVRWIPPTVEDYWPPIGKLRKEVSFPLQNYPTYTEIVSTLEILSASHPNLCRLESVGKSVEARDLYFMKITDYPDLEEDEPEFKYISTMHGNETLGTVLTLNLIELLLRGYASDSRITRLVDETEIWVMPLMNPDGFSRNPRTRFNAQGADLNRTFPNRVDDPVNVPTGRPPEVQAIMAFAAEHSSVMAANFHTGSLLVNYPYDNSAYNDVPQHPDWFTPDNDVFVENSLAYSRHNPPMYASPIFPNGISNGVDWFPISGGMQDWNYVWPGCFEVTIELNSSFSPPTSQLPVLWDDNREAMLSYMERAHEGVRGVVTDSRTGAPLLATVHVEGREKDISTDPDVGDYHRLLLPGTYALTFSSARHQDKTVEGVVIRDGTATRVDAVLDLENTSAWRLW